MTGDDPQEVEDDARIDGMDSTTAPTMTTPWRDTSGAAERLGISRRHVQRLVACGDLRAYRRGRVTRFRIEDLDAYLMAGATTGPAPTGLEPGEIVAVPADLLAQLEQIPEWNALAAAWVEPAPANGVVEDVAVFVDITMRAGELLAALRRPIQNGDPR